MNASPCLSVVVFAYNEAENIKAVLDELGAWIDSSKREIEIVFVDDGSADNTAEIAKNVLIHRSSQIVRHEQNRGIGAALKTGVSVASAPWVTFMPADGQIEPDAIEALYRTANADRADVVLSVYDHRNDGFNRKVLSWGVRWLILLIHGVALCSDGPYLFRRSIFLPEDLPPNSFFLNFEFPIRVLAAGLKVSTVTIRCRPRRSGVSKSTGLRKVTRVAHDLIDLRLRRIRSFVDRSIGV
jgi:dolichol-phosphate mannosyltransferase